MNSHLDPASHSATPIPSTIIAGDRRFIAVFGRPLTSNSIRHAFANSLNLNNEAQLQHAAKRLAHTNIDTLKTCIWGSPAPYTAHVPPAAARGPMAFGLRLVRHFFLSFFLSLKLGRTTASLMATG